MTDFFVWVPLGVLVVAIIILLAVVRWPDELDDAPRPGSESSFAVGAVRLAAVIRSDKGLVIDGLVDQLSLLGPVGTPVTLVVSEIGVDEPAYQLLSRWVETDAVVDVVVPLDSIPYGIVDLRSGDAEMRLAVVGLSS